MDAGASFQLVVLQTELERFKFLVRSLLRARIAKVHIMPVASRVSRAEVGSTETITDYYYFYKLDAHPQHYLLPAQSSLLSSIEQSYLLQHNALLASHYSATFLAAFPPKLRRLDDRGGAGGVGMVEGPDVDTVVFVRCLGPNGASQRLRRGREGPGQYGGLEGDDDDEEDERDNDDDDEVVAISGGYGSVGGEGHARNANGSVRGEERIIRMRRGDVWLARWSAVKEAVTQGVCELL